MCRNSISTCTYKKYKYIYRDLIYGLNIDNVLQGSLWSKLKSKSSNIRKHFGRTLWKVKRPLRGCLCKLLWEKKKMSLSFISASGLIIWEPGKTYFPIPCVFLASYKLLLWHFRFISQKNYLDLKSSCLRYFIKIIQSLLIKSNSTF